MKFGCMMTHTQVHYCQLHESHSNGYYSPPKQCLCSILATIAMTNHEYGQQCILAELDQSDHAVLRLLLQHPSLCHLSLLHSQTYAHHRGPTASSMPPVLHATPCYPKLQQLQHDIKCHDIQLVQHCLTSRITVHSCSWLCTQQAQQCSSGWGVSTQ